MLVLLCVVGLLVLFVIGIIVSSNLSFPADDAVGIVGIVGAVISGFAILLMVLVWVFAPLSWAGQVARYEAIKTTIESARVNNDPGSLERVAIETRIYDDLMSVNKNLATHKRFHDSRWVGIWYSTDIAELEFIR